MADATFDIRSTINELIKDKLDKSPNKDAVKLAEVTVTLGLSIDMADGQAKQSTELSKMIDKRKLEIAAARAYHADVKLRNDAGTAESWELADADDDLASLLLKQQADRSSVAAIDAFYASIVTKAQSILAAL